MKGMTNKIIIIDCDSFILSYLCDAFRLTNSNLSGEFRWKFKSEFRHMEIVNENLWLFKELYAVRVNGAPTSATLDTK